jgi:hypothetical protein
MLPYTSALIGRRLLSFARVQRSAAIGVVTGATDNQGASLALEPIRPPFQHAHLVGDLGYPITQVTSGAVVQADASRQACIIQVKLVFQLITHVAQAMEMAKQAHPDPHICSPGQQNHVDNEPAFYPH